VTERAALVLGLLLLLLTPVIDAILRLDNLAAAAMIAVAAVPLTMMGGQAGILQGDRRWMPLALVYLSAGVPRLVIGVALLAWRPTELTAMVAVVLGQCVPVLVGWYALRGHREPGALSAAHGARSILREAAHNSQALFAFFALSNVDIIVARNVLSDHEAGLYAGGLIMTKAVLFLPQFVVVVAFPSMSSAHERRRALTRSLGAVAAIGVAATLGAWVLSDLAMVFVGGDSYSEIESRLWMFAVLGTTLSMLQLLVYSVLARQGQRSVYLVWAALVALVAVGSRATTLDALLTIVIVVDVTLLAILIALSLWLVRDTSPEPAGETAHRR
jgi:O-antigen/teichoic acid export membrane protein